MKHRIVFQSVRKIVGRGAEHGRGIGLVLGDRHGSRKGAVGPQAGDEIAADVDGRGDYGDAALAALRHGGLDRPQSRLRAEDATRHRNWHDVLAP